MLRRNAELVDTIEELKSVDDFLALAKETPNHGQFDYKLACMLSLIADRNYKEARSIAEKLETQGSHGMYIKEGKTTYEYVVDYCKEHL